jgi:hypothetical protein
MKRASSGRDRLRSGPAICFGLLLAHCTVASAAAANDPALYPAAQCSALWFGWDDLARASTLFDRTPGDLARAEAFRSVAHRLTTTSAASVDAFIADQRGLMMQMIDEGLYGAGESRDLMERLLQTCEDFGATQPETARLR